MNKEKRSRKLVTKHSIKDQLWQQKYQNNWQHNCTKLYTNDILRFPESPFTR